MDGIENRFFLRRADRSEARWPQRGLQRWGRRRPDRAARARDPTVCRRHARSPWRRAARDSGEGVLPVPARCCRELNAQDLPPAWVKPNEIGIGMTDQNINRGVASVNSCGNTLNRAVAASNGGIVYSAHRQVAISIVAVAPSIEVLGCR